MSCINWTSRELDILYHFASLKPKLTWKVISVKLNLVFKNNRTAEACRKKFKRITWEPKYPLVKYCSFGCTPNWEFEQSNKPCQYIWKCIGCGKSIICNEQGKFISTFW